MSAESRGRVVVLASGSGTNCQALIGACESGALEAIVAAVITNNPQAGVIARAEAALVPAIVVEHQGSDSQRRAAADLALIDVITSLDPDLVVLAGWMRVLGDSVCSRFPIINLHPALPGAFAGTNAIQRAFAAWQTNKITESGVMVHWVPDAGVDVGPVLTSEVVAFEAGDTIESFEARIHDTEHRLIVEGTRIALRDLPS